MWYQLLKYHYLLKCKETRNESFTIVFLNTHNINQEVLEVLYPWILVIKGKLGGRGTFSSICHFPKEMCSTARTNAACINIHGQKEKGMCGRPNNGPPKDSHVLMPGTCESYLIQHRLGRYYKLRELEMGKLSCIIWMGP